MEPDIATLIQQLEGDKTREQSAQALVKCGASAVEPLIDLTRKQDGLSCLAAIEILGMIGDARAIQPLLYFVDTFSFFTERAVGALNRIGAPAVEPLCDTLRYGTMEGRINAAWALGLTKDIRSVEALSKACYDGNEDVRRWAFNALLSLGAPRVLPIKVLTEQRLTLQQRYLTLKSLAMVPISLPHGDRSLYLPQGIEKFCNQCLRHAEQEVRAAAADMLSLLTLLRSSEKNAGNEREELLRTVQGDTTVQFIEELPRASSAPDSSQPPAKKNRFWNR